MRYAENIFLSEASVLCREVAIFWSINIFPSLKNTNEKS